MESSDEWPTPEEAAVALAEAEASRTVLAGGVVLPPRAARRSPCRSPPRRWVFADIGGWAGWLLPAGVAVFPLVAGVEVARFRRLTGVWMGGLASRVVDGSATAASASYVLSLGAPVWVAFAHAWWLVVFCAAAGGMAYACSGRRWLRTYRAGPAAHGRGESAAVLAVLAILAVAGLVLLVGR